ncbi:MAG: 1-acyl-sn-glycerol-3-phosphate acyltransferase [Deltaproteobacteria bacterium]|nr:1-acyl-sn-glycerol-3-phosphate acyltransferase [Deltaproteobacteria bacterium]
MSRPHSPAKTVRTLQRMSVIAGVTAGVGAVASVFFAAGKTPEWGYEHLSRLWSGGVLRGCGINASARGLEHVHPDTPAVYVSNHGSEWDWYLFTHFVRLDWRAVIRADLRKFPLGGYFSAKTGQLFLPRRATTADLIRQCRPLLERGTSILMYPEGKRPTGKILGEFRRGAFELAVACNVPVVPVAVVEEHPALGPGVLGRRLGHEPGRVTIVVLPPVHPDGNDAEAAGRLMTSAHRMIEAELTA